MHAEPKIKARVDWGYYSTPQEHLLNRRMPVPRGKVVGGSSSINGMVYVRGNRANYDSWAAEGNTGWDADTVNAAYRRMEDFEDGANEYRGAGGPIRVTRNKFPQEGTLAFLQATSDALGVKVLDDYNADAQEGISRMQQNAADGLRYSASRGYLHDLDVPDAWSCRPRCWSPRSSIEHGRAVGVAVVDKDGTGRIVRAGKEVVLSAGFVGSPQLLMLSGVGHADHLAEHGITAVADLPVGDNLHDHLFHAMTFHVSSSTLRGTPMFFAKGVANELLRPGKTFLANSVFESVGFVRTSAATDVPDLQLHLLPWAYVSPNQDEPIRHDVDQRPALTVLATLIYPKSRGTLRLASGDPMAAPLIDFRYLSEPADLDVLAEGSEMVREIMAGAAFGGTVKSEIHPGAHLQGQDLRREILNRATSVYHGVGTCRMGVDERAVVGPDLRVRGVEGLRVADASIMPSITGGNTNAPSIMIGEKAADLLLDACDTAPLTRETRMTQPLTRPDSITDELLDQLTAQVVSTGGGVWKLTEVYTGEVLTALPQSTPEDIATAFARPARRSRLWAQWPVKKRLEVFKRFHQLLLEHNETIVDLIQAESGKARRMAFDETCDVPMVTSHYLKRAARLLAPVKRGGPVPVLSTSTEIRQPKGVVGIIAPWNFPFATGLSDAIPALMAGNGVVLKPDNKTALSPLYGVHLLYEAGLPQGLFQVVCGEGPDVGPTLIDNANYVMFTGSTDDRPLRRPAGRAEPDRRLPRARRQEPDDRARPTPTSTRWCRARCSASSATPARSACTSSGCTSTTRSTTTSATASSPPPRRSARRGLRLRAGGRLAGLGRPQGPGRRRTSPTRSRRARPC